MSYRFEWHPDKAENNFQKHEITFQEATTVFGDPFALQMTDPDHSLCEERFIVLGMSHRMRLLLVAYAERGKMTRLISARQATRRERRHYEEGKN